MDKRIDAIFSDTIIGILDALNQSNVVREDIVNIFQNKEGRYIAIFYQ